MDKNIIHPKIPFAATDVIPPAIPRALERSGYFDTESSGLFKKGLIPGLTEATFEIQGSIHEIKTRLPPNGPLVHPEALLIQNKKYAEIMSRPMSSYRAAIEINRILERLPQHTVMWAHNKMFDLKLLEEHRFQNLLPPYNLKLKSSGLFDSCHWANLLQCLPGNGDLKAAISLKLPDVAAALGVTVHPALLHTSSGDVALLKMVVYRLCEVYPDFLVELDQKLSRPARKQQLHENEYFWLPSFSSSEDRTPVPYMALADHPLWRNYVLCVRLDRSEYQNGATQAIELLKTGFPESRRLFRPVHVNQETSYIGSNSPLAKGFVAVNDERALSALARDLTSNTALIEALQRTVLDNQPAYPKPKYAEQARRELGFDIDDRNKDRELIIQFHTAPPEDRYEISLKFEEARFHELALWILLDDSPAHLPDNVRRQLRRKIRERLLCTEGPTPWMTIPDCLEAIDELRQKELSPVEFEILRDYFIWLQRMIRQWDLVVPKQIVFPEIPF